MMTCDINVLLRKWSISILFLHNKRDHTTPRRALTLHTYNNVITSQLLLVKHSQCHSCRQEDVRSTAVRATEGIYSLLLWKSGLCLDIELDPLWLFIFPCCLSSLSISVDGVPRTTIINAGQHILIEGEDEDNPYVAKVVRLFGDGESDKMFESESEIRFYVVIPEKTNDRRPRVSGCSLGRTDLIGWVVSLEIIYNPCNSKPPDLSPEAILRHREHFNTASKNKTSVTNQCSRLKWYSKSSECDCKGTVNTGRRQVDTEWSEWSSTLK